MSADDVVWTVNDAESTILALDADSLLPVKSFHHLGVPEAIFATGRKAWYLCSREAECPTERDAASERLSSAREV